MSSRKEKIASIQKSLRKHRGGLAIVAKIAGKKPQYVTNCFNNENRHGINSAKRIFKIAIEVIILLDNLKKYDEENF